MVYESALVEKEAALAVAKQMCAAARTAPKTRGVDHLSTLILTDDDLKRLSEEMLQYGKEFELDFFERDAQNVAQSQAVVLLGYAYVRNGLGKACRMCGYEDCAACAKAGAVCVFNPIDLGIAIGSAVGIAADFHIDSRVMFSVGRTALRMGLFPDNVQVALGIPLSVSGKSPYFDRKFQRK